LTHRYAATILVTLREAARRAAESEPMHIHPLDLAIVIVYLLAVTALGVYFRGKQRDVCD
jgi:hypothetical protein